MTGAEETRGRVGSLFDFDYWGNTWPKHEVVLTRANAADGYPRALTPLSQDLVLTFEEAGVRNFYFNTLRALRPSECPDPFMQAFYGYVFLNADQMGTLGEAMPGSTRAGMYETILGLEGDPDYRPPKPSAQRRAALALRAVGLAPRLARVAAALAKRIDSQIRQVDQARPASPDRVDLEEAAAWLRRLERLQIPAWESLMQGAAIGIAMFESTERMITRLVGDSGSDLTNRLHVGLGGNESAESALALRRLADVARSERVDRAIGDGASVADVTGSNPAFAAEFAAVIERFGYRAPAELELRNPSWRAEPAHLLEVLGIELRRQPTQTDKTDIRGDAERELASVGGAKSRAVGPMLRLSRRFMATRENCKVPIVKVFDETRRLLAAVTPGLVESGVLPSREAVHMLTYSELVEVLDGARGPGTAELERRLVDYERCFGLDIPELVTALASGLQPVTDEQLKCRGLLPPAKRDLESSVVKGIGVSSGRLTAVARVLDDPFEPFEAGEIVIAKTVDPGWSAILSCAGAVVLNMGGPMSHGAVVSRELGIPCVVNARDATDIVTSGSTVTVDGSTGEVLLGG